ncbi:transcription factor RFX3-like isoform X3 [Dendronephthya gigantea]|uniref:transcription factor RFX3-like isoform X3 n=1 Tax=Dendronephthya gigantea TaxID=151771 RepID=UPI00106B2E14|nr:transcription factor RFX3-like isoform X3 [Dendronephthya gigantea]
MAVHSGASIADQFTRGLQVTTAGHAKSSSGVQQKTIQQQSIQQSILHTITPDNFTSNNSIKNEGFANSDVHFVEGDQPTMYANGPGSFAYGDATIFGQQGAPAGYLDGSQHPPTYTTPATNSPTMVPGTQGQVITYQHTSGLAGQINPRPPITHTTRASPATVAWLLENYETSEGVSLPRSTLYNHYLQHCQANKLDAVNAASFGKLIRSVFVGLKTRRLGTRGNSKYHYYGIRIQPNSPLNALVDHEIQGAMRQSPSAHKSRLKLTTKIENESFGEEQSRAGEDSQQTKNQQEQHQQYLGDISQGLREFKPVQATEPLPDGISSSDIVVFSQLYREHCEAILDVVVNLQFALVESLWHTFWRAPSSEEESKQDSQTPINEGSLEERLPKIKLTLLCSYQPILDFVKDADHVLYQTLVETLIPEVLRPIPGSLTSAIRNYAKCLESWLMGSLTDIPQKMVDLKISTCSAFSQTLRRYTSLNHLAQAARAVLQNPQQINQMLADLNRVDFANVQEQASWVCQCDDEVVNQLEADFKATLAQQNSLEKWADWLQGVVNKVLASTEGTPAYPKAARQFLLKWSFYSSMVIRDLTLRSAASFGSFHLIRLLYDEYMFYLIEHKVADATGKSPIAVMGEFVGLGANFAASLAPLDALRQNGLGDSGSEVTSEDDSGDSVKQQPSTDISTSDEPDVKKQRTN